jgi:4-hydroxybenzoyl-CoA thioesterase
MRSRMPPFRHRMPVRFADVDHAGIVYYPVFFHYFHVAFEELFIARMGARSYVELLDRDRVGFPAVSSSCDFKAPLRFGDTVEIELAIERIGEKSITFRYRVWKAAEGDRAGETLAAEGRTVCAVVDLSAFRAIAIPDRLRPMLDELTSA